MRKPILTALTIVLTTVNDQGEAEQLLSEGLETIEILSKAVVKLPKYHYNV